MNSVSIELGSAGETVALLTSFENGKFEIYDLVFGYNMTKEMIYESIIEKSSSPFDEIIAPSHFLEETKSYFSSRLKAPFETVDKKQVEEQKDSILYNVLRHDCLKCNPKSKSLLRYCNFCYYPIFVDAFYNLMFTHTLKQHPLPPDFYPQKNEKKYHKSST
jgi:hypothetical protein